MRQDGSLQPRATTFRKVLITRDLAGTERRESLCDPPMSAVSRSGEILMVFRAVVYGTLLADQVAKITQIERPKHDTI